MSHKGHLISYSKYDHYMVKYICSAVGMSVYSCLIVAHIIVSAHQTNPKRTNFNLAVIAMRSMAGICTITVIREVAMLHLYIAQ